MTDDNPFETFYNILHDKLVIVHANVAYKDKAELLIARFNEMEKRIAQLESQLSIQRNAVKTYLEIRKEANSDYCAHHYWFKSRQLCSDLSWSLDKGLLDAMDCSAKKEEPAATPIPAHHPWKNTDPDWNNPDFDCPPDEPVATPQPEAARDASGNRMAEIDNMRDARAMISGLVAENAKLEKERNASDQKLAAANVENARISARVVELEVKTKDCNQCEYHHFDGEDPFTYECKTCAFQSNFKEKIPPIKRNQATIRDKNEDCTSKLAKEQPDGAPDMLFDLHIDNVVRRLNVNEARGLIDDLALFILNTIGVPVPMSKKPADHID